MKGYGILCQKMVSVPVYHFVLGHLGVLQDVTRYGQGQGLKKCLELKKQ